jgi:hypothetical protein
MEKDPITITLTVAQWNIVLNALIHRPYGEVASVIQELRDQGNKQQALDPEK